MTETELHRLEANAKVILEWIEAKRNGVEVVFEVADSLTNQWFIASQYFIDINNLSPAKFRVTYPKPIKKREPKKGEFILCKDKDFNNWTVQVFLRFSDNGNVIASSFMMNGEGNEWTDWKFPDDPDPAKEESILEKLNKTYEKAWAEYKEAALKSVRGVISSDSVVKPHNKEGTFFDGITGKTVYKSASEPLFVKKDVTSHKKTSTIPLTSEDFKGVWWVRKSDWHEEAWDMITSLTQIGISCNYRQTLDYKELYENGWLRSQDCVNWMPCHREIQE